jgi:hypothetical protein
MNRTSRSPITTEVIRYDENVAVVRAATTNMKGTFQEIGMRQGLKTSIEPSFKAFLAKSLSKVANRSAFELEAR